MRLKEAIWQLKTREAK